MRVLCTLAWAVLGFFAPPEWVASAVVLSPVAPWACSVLHPALGLLRELAAVSGVGVAVAFNFVVGLPWGALAGLPSLLWLFPLSVASAAVFFHPFELA